MTQKFRPRLDALEAREVPAALSFQLPGGATGSGLFSTPDGVDPAQSSQIIALDDLSVTKGGAAYAVQPGAAAHYASGVLVGVTATAVGPDVIQLNNATAQVGGSVATVAYDAGDTRQTFTLPDGTVGAISYELPLALIDTAQASQTLPPLSFNLNIAGQNFAHGAANYTTAPALHFAHGVLQGVSFGLNLAGTGSPYLGISVANGIATAQSAVTGQFIAAPVADQTAAMTIDFSTIGIPAAGQAAAEVKIRVTAAGNVQKTVTVVIQPGATPSDVRDSFESALKAVGFNATARGTTKLEIKGTTGANPAQLQKVETIDFGFSGTGGHPKLVTQAKAPNGDVPEYKNIQ